MQINYFELVNDFKNSVERMCLIEELQKSSNRITPIGELADDQVIVSSKHSDDVIKDVFSAIYKKLPKKIVLASERSKIVVMK